MFLAKNEESQIGFDYDDGFMNVWYNSDNDSEQTNCFESVCFSKKGYNLVFSRFCLRCKNVFLRYFTRALYVI